LIHFEYLNKHGQFNASTASTLTVVDDADGVNQLSDEPCSQEMDDTS